jgi:hypothetical protein
MMQEIESLSSLLCVGLGQFQKEITTSVDGHAHPAPN